MDCDVGIISWIKTILKHVAEISFKYNSQISRDLIISLGNSIAYSRLLYVSGSYLN